MDLLGFLRWTPRIKHKKKSPCRRQDLDHNSRRIGYMANTITTIHGKHENHNYLKTVCRNHLGVTLTCNAILAAGNTYSTESPPH